MGRMAEQQRKLLEQMMGPEAMGVQPIATDWWDVKVCRNFLCGTCPHDIFGNTKMDLGPCPRIHSEKIVTAFKLARTTTPHDPRFKAFDQEYQNNIYAFVDDCDRKIRMSQKRLEKTPEENKRTVDLMKEVGEIELAIQASTEEVEALGEAGKIEESMAKLEAVEALKQEKADKERELQRLTETGGASGHQKLRVCETCGAYLSVLDSDRRLADHFGGKMHLGYHELRKLVEQFNEQRRANMNGGGGPGGNFGGPAKFGQPNNNNMNMNNGPPPTAPSGPSGQRPPAGPAGSTGGPGLFPPGISGSGGGESQPHTPLGQIGVKPEPGEYFEDGLGGPPGHGEKRKREAMELVEAGRGLERGASVAGGGGEEDRERKRHRSRERGERHERDREREREGGGMRRMRGIGMTRIGAIKVGSGRGPVDMKSETENTAREAAETRTGRGTGIGATTAGDTDPAKNAADHPRSEIAATSRSVDPRNLLYHITHNLLSDFMTCDGYMV